MTRAALSGRVIDYLLCVKLQEHPRELKALLLQWNYALFSPAQLHFSAKKKHLLMCQMCVGNYL